MAELDYHYIALLVDRTKEGDRDSFAELYMITYQRQYRFACNYLRDEHLAKDAVQESYISVLKNISALADSHLFISWLNQITFRICFNMQQKQKRNLAELAEFDSAMTCATRNILDNPEEYVAEIDHQEYIFYQILSLPLTEAQVIIHRYYNNLKLEDIASLMNISRSSVIRYLNSGRQKLKKRLKHYADHKLT
jgi:RNA polymerase sigma-70 factor (ECF subfamily)